MDFTGRVAVVTGGGSGIGEAACALLAAHGASVAVLDLDAGQAERVAATLPSARPVVVDVSRPDSVEHAFEQARKGFGRIDVVVHAAGVDDPETKRLAHEQRSRGEAVDVVSSLTDAQWHRMISVNLDGAFYVLRAATRHLAIDGGGAIVMIGSETGVRGSAGFPHYGASKGGVHALVRSAAKELSARGIRVNGIAPGVIDTPMSRRTVGAYDGDPALIAPIGRTGRPEEIASVALFLASDYASYVAGEIVNVDGGRVAG